MARPRKDHQRVTYHLEPWLVNALKLLAADDAIQARDDESGGGTVTASELAAEAIEDYLARRQKKDKSVGRVIRRAKELARG